VSPVTGSASPTPHPLAAAEAIAHAVAVLVYKVVADAIAILVHEAAPAHTPLTSTTIIANFEKNMKKM
jgi:hypothetical protein